MVAKCLYASHTQSLTHVCSNKQTARNGTAGNQEYKAVALKFLIHSLLLCCLRGLGEVVII